MPSLRLLLGGLPLALLAACHADSKPDKQAAETPAAAAPAAQTTNARYRCYRGLLPGTRDSITLHVVQGPPTSGLGANVFASYHDAAGHPYALQAEPQTDPDSLVLFDISPEKASPDRDGPKWRLRRTGRELRGTLAGQPLTLRESPAAVPLNAYFYADSVAAYPGRPGSVHGHLHLLAALPAAESALRANVLRELRNDTLANQPVGTLAQLWEQDKAIFQQLYRTDVAGLMEGLEDSTEVPSYALRYEQQTATYVYWNQPNLLSLGIFTYVYTGGAHGNYGTTAASYDPRTGQRLRFEDVFRPGTDAQISAVLDQAVRRTLRIPAEESLETQLFVKKMPVTNNFYLTGSGAVFIYTPYEIASYAQGEIRVFVPFTELKAVLVAGGPLSS